MKTAHTPGPWTIAGSMNGNSVAIVRDLPRDSIEATRAMNGGGGHICEVVLPHAGAVEAMRSSPSEAMANAHLIAAAPRMLAVLAALVADLPELNDEDTPIQGSTAVEVLVNHWDLLKEVIAQAKGEA